MQTRQIAWDGQPTGLCAGGFREIWRIDRDGDAYRIWEKVVPRIDDSVLDCAVYLYHSEQDAIEGARSGGSGFLVGVPVGWDDSDWKSRPRGHHVYAVTNSHVVENNASVVRLNTRDGATKVIDLSPDSWIHHPKGDDIAIAAIEPDRELHKFKYVGVGIDMFVTQERLKKSAIGPGDETFTVGRFIARDERQSNAPLVRFGHISGTGTEFISREDGRSQEGFLIESHSTGGLSGAPVFVWIPLERTVNIRDPEKRSQFRREVRSYQYAPREYFLGVDWGHLPDETDMTPPGMAGVVPAWKLLEVLSTPEVVEMRQQKEKNDSKIPRAKLDVRQRPTQKSHAGESIPIPTKSQFLNDLKKATRKLKPS
jgi:hypothetical protein